MRTACLKLPGYPDMSCDLVAEAIVDEYLERDRESRLRINVCGGSGALFVSGEVQSLADIDVAAIVRRTLGRLGVGEGIEPFVSLEAVPAGISALSIQVPVTVMGFACDETPENVPLPTSLARRIAKRLRSYRETDEQGFWLGADAEVFVSLKQNTMPQIFLNVEHGSMDIADVRSKLIALVTAEIPGARVRVNDLGPLERRGIAKTSGSSSRNHQAYGSMLPSAVSSCGMDPYHPLKAGAWIARAAARSLVAAGAHAALVHLTYEPGRLEPMTILVRDEKGKRIDAGLSIANLRLDRVMGEWWRSGLNQEAMEWMAGADAALPWET